MSKKQTVAQQATKWFNQIRLMCSAATKAAKEAARTIEQVVLALLAISAAIHQLKAAGLLDQFLTAAGL